MTLIFLSLLQTFAVNCSSIDLEHIKISKNCNESQELEAFDEAFKINKNCFVSLTESGEQYKIFYYVPHDISFPNLDFTNACSGLDLNLKEEEDGLLLRRSCRLLLNFGDGKSCICSSRGCRESDVSTN